MKLIAENSPYRARINQNIFTGNTASCGAIYLSAKNINNQPEITLENSAFLQNKAVLGEALSQITLDQMKQKTQFRANIFINNRVE